MNINIILHIILCSVGLSLAVVRLKLVTDPHPTIKCRIRWAAWVLAHTMWVLGFSAGIWYSFFANYDPSLPEWLIRGGLLIYLLLKIKHPPREIK